MKANELMIGDWVQGFVPDTYSRVEAISEHRLGIITSGGHYIETAPDDFQPIPLTPEILEKNGFEAVLPEIWEYEDERDSFLVAYIGGEFWWWLYGSLVASVNTVHELQHALRLCGIKKEIKL